MHLQTTNLNKTQKLKFVSSRVENRLSAFSPLPTMFSKSVFLSVIFINKGLFSKGYI